MTILQLKINKNHKALKQIKGKEKWKKNNPALVMVDMGPYLK